MEKRDNYQRKVTESLIAYFITNNVPNVKGLILALAGSVKFENVLQKSDLFAKIFSPVVIKVVFIL